MRCAETTSASPWGYPAAIESGYTHVLDDRHVRASVGLVGDADDRHGRSFVDSFKTELISDRVWQTRSQLELATLAYVSWFNNQRLHQALDDIPPVEVEALRAAVIVS